MARDLLGKHLVRNVGGEQIIVELRETEAYTGIADKACHSYGGRRTQRTETMYKPGGHAYIYLIYGMYELFNIVTGGEEDPSGVLVRVAAIVKGRDIISQNRFGKMYDSLSAYQKNNLLNGPGKVTRALKIDKSLYGTDLVNSRELYVLAGENPAGEIKAGKRINIDYAEEAKDYLYRFYL